MLKNRPHRLKRNARLALAQDPGYLRGSGKSGWWRQFLSVLSFSAPCLYSRASRPLSTAPSVAVLALASLCTGVSILRNAGTKLNCACEAYFGRKVSYLNHTNLVNTRMGPQRGAFRMLLTGDLWSLRGRSDSEHECHWDMWPTSVWLPIDLEQ